MLEDGPARRLPLLGTRLRLAALGPAAPPQEWVACEMAPGEVRGPGRNPSVRSGVLGAETEQPSAATCRAWALGQPPGLSVLCRIGVRSACHFLPLRSDTSPSTRPEAWAGHGLWRPRLVFPWMLGGGRREEAGALGAGPVKAPLGSAVGVSGYSSTWGPAQPSTWAGVPSHVARKCEARRLSSTEDLAKGCPPSSPPRHLFPCSAEGCVRPRGRGTADGSLNVATRATKAVTRPRRPSHCCPPCTGFQGPHAPGVLGGPPPRQGVDTVRCHVCNTFACPRTLPLSRQVSLCVIKVMAFVLVTGPGMRVSGEQLGQPQAPPRARGSLEGAG